MKNVRSVCRLIFLHVDVHLFQHHLWKCQSFLHCIAFAPLSKVLTIHMWFFFWVLCSVPLSCLFNCQITIYLYTLFISLKEVLNLVSASLPALDIYRQLHPRTVEYTFFSSSSGKNTKIDHILDHKTYLNEFKKMEVI